MNTMSKLKVTVDFQIKVFCNLVQYFIHQPSVLVELSNMSHFTEQV